MPRHEAPQDELVALEEGRAFFAMSAYRKVRITGADARAWLHDLVTSDVASLQPGGGHRSLLLSPTGRIRADLVVTMDDEGFLLLQTLDQPDDVSVLLAKYVLSSDVSLQDVTGSMPVFALAGSPTTYAAGSAEGLVARGLLEAGPDAVEVWRIRRGEPRMGVDFAQDALPAEAGLEWTIDFAKGCFLGQESVARVRNLGHPPTVLRHLVGPSTLASGAPVLAGGTPAGEVTSAAAAADGRTVAIARLRWDASSGPWTTLEGSALGSMD